MPDIVEPHVPCVHDQSSAYTLVPVKGAIFYTAHHRSCPLWVVLDRIQTQHKHNGLHSRMPLVYYWDPVCLLP